MIVVWVNKRDWKTPGPIVNMAVHNAGSFSAIGIETHLCIGAGAPSDTDADLCDFYGISKTPLLTVHRVPRYRLFGGSYSASVFFYACRLIQELAKKDAVSVFTRESGFLFFLNRLCRKFPTVKGFYELHDLYAELSWVEKRKWDYRREWCYEHIFLPKINGIICITKEQEKRYNAVFPHLPSCAVPLGTEIRDDAAADPEEKRKRRTLMYVGHLHPEKGFDFLLSAAQALSRENVRIVFWGEKEKRIGQFENRAKAMGVSGSVQFVPFQPPEVMHRALSQEASLGVVMLQDTYYNRYLTCPVKALDYLSHGIPAIGSDIPSVHEVLEDAGTYVQPENLAAFTAAVLELLNNPAHYAEKAMKAGERAKAITWTLRAKTLSEFAAVCDEKNPLCLSANISRQKP